MASKKNKENKRRTGHKEANTSRKKKSQNHTGADSKVKKTIHDYTGEELDALYESDPEEHERLWTEAELEAINNPDNHGKST